MPEKKPAAGFDFESARTEPDQLAALLERAIASRARDVARWGEHLFRIDPNTARRYALYARALASEGKFSQAEEIFERYEKMYGDDAESLYARAQVSLLRNLTGRAEELLTRALEKSPNEEKILEQLLALAATSGHRAASLRAAAAIEGAWRAKILLAREFMRDLAFDEAATLIAAALKSDDRRALTAASAALIESRLYDRALDLVLPLVGDDTPRGALLNLAHAAIMAVRLDVGDELLSRLEREKGDPRVPLLKAALQQQRKPVERLKPQPQLLETLTGFGRVHSEKARQRFYRKLLVVDLMLAVSLPLVDEPEEESTDRFDALQAIVRHNAIGERVVLVFTHDEAVSRWSPEAFAVVAPARRIFVWASSNRFDVVINAAGPSSAELGQKELAAVAEGDVPVLTEQEIVAQQSYFLVEPFVAAPSDALVQRVKADIAEYPEVVEAYLLEVVHERFGRAIAAALVFGSDAPPSARRDILFDLGDPTVHARRPVRVQFFELNDELVDVARKQGHWLIEP